ncbi:histidine kinase N-terminal 7TM domain-containing protein [Halapricum salinum]|uniref:histidine kinase n=1 Tax=Halapricum salinum TaxID=1457250 RepID=A0A4D6HD86_9EURY|nr:histidine kinase N-terminal 7TM domain-containing protein [Halapricum salinum]QCC51939.1 PAS domain-containing protein [Halapricum salinum]
MYAQLVVAGSLAAGVGTLYLVARLWQYRERPGARLFLAALSMQAIFCFVYGAGLLVFDPLLRRVMEAVVLLALPWMAVLFLGFAFGYTGRGHLLRSVWYGIPLATAGIFTVVVATTSYHGLIWQDFDIVRIGDAAGAQYTHEPALFVMTAFAVLWVVLGTVLLFDTVFSYGPLFRGEAIAVGVSPLSPGVVALLWLFEVGPQPVTAINLTAVAFLPHVALDGYAFVKRDMFEFLPGTRRAGEQAAIEDLANPVLIVDTDGRIVTLNPAAESLIDLDEEAALTRQLGDVLDATVDPAADEQRIALRSDGKRREYLVVPAELTDTAGGQVGYTLLFQDVTEAIEREQRLTVMNRILRHNLRNDLNVVHGFLEAGRERVDDTETSQMLRRASRKTDELVSTGEKVRDIESTIGDAGTRSSFDLGSQLRAIADDAERDSGGVVERTVPDAVEVRADRDVFELVVANLLENALVHAAEDGEPIALSATASEDAVTITVADDGPGIPENELETIERGTETDLVHGSGLGLWIVTWGVRHLGGDVAFDSDDDGTTVRVTIPREA